MQTFLGSLSLSQRSNNISLDDSSSQPQEAHFHECFRHFIFQGEWVGEFEERQLNIQGTAKDESCILLKEEKIVEQLRI